MVAGGQDQGSGDGGGQQQNTDQQTQSQSKDQQQKTGLRDALTDDQRRELDTQIAAARRQAEADAKTRFESDAARAKADADATADRQKQIDEGKFSEAKASLEGERDTFKSQAEAEKSRADRAIKLLEGQIADRVKALPTAIAEHYPKDVDVLDQIAWLEDPVRKQAIAAYEQQGQRMTGNPASPRPKGSTTEQERIKQAAQSLAQSGQYTPF